MTIASDVGRPASVRSFWLGVAAYLVPSFPIAFVWHLVLFEQKYHALGIYRDDPIIPFGLASMVIQGVMFSWIYPRVFAGNRSLDPEGRAALRARRRPAVVVVYDAGDRGKTSDGFDFGLRGSGNRIHDPAVRDRGTVDRAGLEEMMRRTNEVN